jgi:hypothetical protein
VRSAAPMIRASSMDNSKGVKRMVLKMTTLLRHVILVMTRANRKPAIPYVQMQYNAHSAQAMPCGQRSLSRMSAYGKNQVFCSFLRAAGNRMLLRMSR